MEFNKSRPVKIEEEQYIPEYDVLTVIMYDWSQSRSVAEPTTTPVLLTGSRSYFIGMASGCKGISIDFELGLMVQGEEHWGVCARISEIGTNDPVVFKPFYMHKMDRIRLCLRGNGNPVILGKLVNSLDFGDTEDPAEIGFLDMTFPREEVHHKSTEDSEALIHSMGYGPAPTTTACGLPFPGTAGPIRISSPELATCKNCFAATGNWPLSGGKT